LQYPKNFSEIEELRAWKTRKKEEMEWIKIVTAVYEIPSSLLSKHCLHISSHIILAAFRERQTTHIFCSVRTNSIYTFIKRRDGGIQHCIFGVWNNPASHSVIILVLNPAIFVVRVGPRKLRDIWMVGLRQVMGIGWIMVTWIYIGTYSICSLTMPCWLACKAAEQSSYSRLA
jgi:hypothetical protein